ncbi:transposase [Chitinophagaceae bacterium LB-8]|uniref:Transposase n=1 Tax=Paraflavisolibacter caeni TaxID=2982496 RepID=A0A9X2XSU5_9BACT|nr:transposase [Paraflavisolibacter caeni]MCU7547722.1 transposase [Paraflavisolibacter caeni]
MSCTGTRTEVKRRWTPQGHRPVCRIKLGYEFTYLYAALAPKSGRLIALLLPDMSGDSFEIFFTYFEQQVDKLHRRRKTLLILDQASTHQHREKKSKVVIKYLPVASPELNCVERFFEELRKPLSNHIFKGINEVERFVCRVLKRWYLHPNLIIKLCLYPYMLYDKPK